MKKAPWILSIILLLVTGLLGLYNGPNELGDWTTPLQMSVTFGVLLYGLSRGAKPSPGRSLRPHRAR